MNRKLYIDFDCTIANSVKRIVDLYNKYYHMFDDYKPVHWTEINTWNFAELKAATTPEILELFEKPCFFQDLEFMDNAKEVLLHFRYSGYKITVVSMGHKENLKHKEEWLKEHVPYARFIGVDLDEYKDKSHLDLHDGVFIDDNPKYLNTNAKVNICFGDVYEWNKDWDGVRLYNWTDVMNYLEKEGL